MDTELNKQIRKKGFEKGLLLGLIFLVAGIFTYYFMTGMTDNLWLIMFSPVLFSVILPIVIAVFVTISLRKEIGGFWVFRQAVTGIFIMFFTAYVFSFVGRDLLFAKFVEPNMVDNMKVSMTNATTAMLEKSGQEQEVIDKQIEDVEKQFDKQKNASIGDMIQSHLIAIILLFVVSLIFAAIFKRNPIRNGLDDAIDPAV